MGKFEQIIEARQKLCEFNENPVQRTTAQPQPGQTNDPAQRAKAPTQVSAKAPAPAQTPAQPVSDQAPAPAQPPAQPVPAQAPNASPDANLVKIFTTDPNLAKITSQALETGTPVPNQFNGIDPNILKASVAASINHA